MSGLAKRTAERWNMLEPALMLRDAIASTIWQLGWNWKRGFGRFDQRLKETYLRSHDERKLHLGAGNNELEGWLNTDLFPPYDSLMHLDASKPFPFADATFDFVFSEHMIEHISYADGLTMLNECHRVLKPGGLVRISTPDIRFLIELYDAQSTAVTDAYLDWQTQWINENEPRVAVPPHPVHVINNFVRDWGHQFIYDQASLARAITGAGFTDIRQCEINQSDHAKLRGLENTARAPDGLVALETMTLEARKPE